MIPGSLIDLIHLLKISVADSDSGSGASLTPGSGIRDEQPGSYFRELRNNFCVQKLNSLMRIRDPG
jgi:hypothetical protein